MLNFLPYIMHHHLTDSQASQPEHAAEHTPFSYLAIPARTQFPRQTFARGV